MQPALDLMGGALLPRSRGFQVSRDWNSNMKLRGKKCIMNFTDFSEKPFEITPDPKFSIWHRATGKALNAMMKGIESRQEFISITGEVGTGKTTLIYYLLMSLDDKVKTAFIFKSINHLWRIFGNHFKGAIHWGYGEGQKNPYTQSCWISVASWQRWNDDDYYWWSTASCNRNTARNWGNYPIWDPWHHGGFRLFSWDNRNLKIFKFIELEISQPTDKDQKQNYDPDRRRVARLYWASP